MFKPEGFAAVNVIFTCEAHTLCSGFHPTSQIKMAFTSAVELTPLEHDRKSVKTASIAENENAENKLQIAITHNHLQEFFPKAFSLQCDRWPSVRWG